MALPKLLQKLFTNNGSGPVLREEILPKTYEMPIFLDTEDGEYDWGEVHTFVPEGVTQVQLVSIEADGSGTADLVISMGYDIDTGTSVTITTDPVDCSAFANKAVYFGISGTMDQTKISACIRFTS